MRTLVTRVELSDQYLAGYMMVDYHSYMTWPTQLDFGAVYRNMVKMRMIWASTWAWSALPEEHTPAICDWYWRVEPWYSVDRLELELVLGDVFRFSRQERADARGSTSKPSNTDCSKIMGPEVTPACPLPTEENLLST